MRNVFWTAVALFSLLTVLNFAPSSALADISAVSAQKAIQTILDKQNAAMSKLDAQGSWVGYANNFYTVGQDGQRCTRQQLEVQLKATMRIAKSITDRSRIVKLTLHNDTASAIVNSTNTIVFLDAAKKKQVLTDNNQSSEVWIKSHGQWLESSETTLSYTDTLNGQPVEQK